MQISLSIYPEIQEEDAVCRVASVFRRDIQRVGQTERKRGAGRSSDARSCTYDDINSSEVCGVAGGGYIKGKSAIHLARVYMGKKRNFVGQSFWARGYYVSTVGRDEQVVREYIRNQEAEERRLDQLDLLR